MSNVRYEASVEGTIEILGGRAVGTNSNGGSVTIQAGLVDEGGHGGPVSLIASNAKAYITSPATPGFLVIGFSPPFPDGTSLTGLTLATLYDVSLTFDTGASNVTQTVTIDGTYAQKFYDLIAKVYLQIVESYEDVIFTNPIASLDPTGLTNDATVYSFIVQFDSQVASQTVNVTGSSAQTFGTLVTAINAAMIGGTVSIVGSSLRVKSSGTVPPVLVSTLFDNNLFGSITPNLWTSSFSPLVTALGIMKNLGGALQITSNGCGGGCFGTGSNVIDNGADTQIYLFGALANFSGPTTTFNGDAASYSQTNGANTFIKAGDSGGTGVGGSYAGLGAGHITLQAGNAPNTILGGALNRENGGPVDIFGGDGGGNQAVGGHVNLVGGSTGNGAVKGGSGGSVTLTAGDTAGDFNTFTGNAGDVAFNAGNGTNGARPGDISFDAGQGDGTPGYLNENFVNNPTGISGTTPSGLTPGTYDVSFTVNGGAPFTVTLVETGSDFPTFQDVINQLNSGGLNSNGAQASILSGNTNGHIHIKTVSTTHTSTVVDNDFPVYGGGNTYLFGALNQWGNSEDGPFPGTDAPGGDIHMEARQTGEIFLAGAAGIQHVGGIQNSARMSFSTANSASSSNRNTTYYTGNTFTAPSPNVFTVDDIDPNGDTVTTRGSVPIKEITCQAFRLMVSAINEAIVLPATEFASWHIEGTIARGDLTAASTTLVGAVTSVKRDSGGNAVGWTVVVTADTTLGGLIITVTTPAFTGAGVSFGIDLELISQR